MASSDCRFNYPYLRGYFDIKLSLLEGIVCMCNVRSDVTNRAFLSWAEDHSHVVASI